MKIFGPGYSRLELVSAPAAITVEPPEAIGRLSAMTNLPRYDATNGTMSAGVMFRSQRMLKETGAH
jgi:hypothetical protein